MARDLGDKSNAWLRRYYARTSVADLVASDSAQLFSQLFQHSDFDIGLPQRDAWIGQFDILRASLKDIDPHANLFFEFNVPRVGKRIDAVLIVGGLVIVIEFKVGADKFPAYAVEQVWDYALDLKNFHSESHDKTIVPILVATEAPTKAANLELVEGRQEVYQPIKASVDLLADAIGLALANCKGVDIDPAVWSSGHYSPTPTIIDAAIALYGGHSVMEISRSDASAINLTTTSDTVSRIIHTSSAKRQKSICFVTGVPGAGKTLVGLNAATQHTNKDDALYSVFLSGNGPLVKILQEALARDKVAREKELGQSMTLSAARSEVKAFIQNVHHFRDEGLVDMAKAPHEHVALFDEAQRAWDLPQTASFMKRKKNKPGFEMSEPEFLISCMDRHPDWAVVVCLVGGGQEINTGEAGIGEWVEAIMRSYPDWHVYVSPNLRDSEFAAGHALERLQSHPHTQFEPSLHLSVSMRSFRAENVSHLVKSILDLELDRATQTLAELRDRYPVVLCRDLREAKEWVRSRAQGSERFGMVASSQAQRLRPIAIDVRVNIDPVHWFLDAKDDVRSSWFLEDAASEFDVQGLELDWTVVVWDADFRHNGKQWENWSFTGGKWQRINAEQRKLYQKNAYRVLLTRARQGMVIVVPEGDVDDYSRQPGFYDGTWRYLQSIGLATV
jgi:hypothetical protein